MYRHKLTYRLVYFLIAIMPQIAATLCGISFINSLFKMWNGQPSFNYGYMVVVTLILIRILAIEYLDRTDKFKKLNISLKDFRDDTHAIAIYAFLIGCLFGTVISIP